VPATWTIVEVFVATAELESSASWACAAVRQSIANSIDAAAKVSETRPIENFIFIFPLNRIRLILV
jgi:hypothetical protein